MCNACGFLCCASDVFDGCGCDHCPEPDCHACFNCGDRDCDGGCMDDQDDYDIHFDTWRAEQVG